MQTQVKGQITEGFVQIKLIFYKFFIKFCKMLTKSRNLAEK